MSICVLTYVYMSVCVWTCICTRARMPYACIYVIWCACRRVSMPIYASIHVCMCHVCMYACVSMHVRMNVCMHRQNFQDSPRGSAIFVNKNQDSPRGSPMLFKIFRTLRAGGRFSSKFSGRSAWERNFHRDFKDAPHGSAIFFKFSARERDFDHKRTIWSQSVWYRISIEIFPLKKLRKHGAQTCFMSPACTR